MHPKIAPVLTAGLIALSALLAGCGTEAPVSASAQPPHALTSLSGGWQVGASDMRDSEGRVFTVCTLQQGKDDGSRFWLATTAASISRELYIGLRSPALPAVGGRVPRQASILIDGTAFRPERAQQAGDTLSMVIPAAKTEGFLQAFAKGNALVAGADDLPGFSLPVSLQGSANGRREWAKCIEIELKTP
ncbi:hypothetical protein [Zavarzinia sp.]|uniref:hypothetical protein n=1 Tax=Zavarzinia sp. TaxID=2027920 RepID=UPI003BB56D4D